MRTKKNKYTCIGQIIALIISQQTCLYHLHLDFTQMHKTICYLSTKPIDNQSETVVAYHASPQSSYAHSRLDQFPMYRTPHGLPFL
jgi:hypothetical protein